MDKRLLIVDDERDLTDTLALSLRAAGGFAISTAYDGEEGLQKAASVKPDVILLDISMPIVDGWEMCRRLRDDDATSAIPLVVMTAGSAKDVNAKAAQEGVFKVLLKPLDADKLRDVLRSCAETRRRPRER